VRAGASSIKNNGGGLQDAAFLIVGEYRIYLFFFATRKVKFCPLQFAIDSSD
jgi:hypothetical protein